MCINFGALNDALNRISASWADSSDRRLIAVSNSVQRLAIERRPSSCQEIEVLSEALPALVPER